jgi:hypothetical protein
MRKKQNTMKAAVVADHRGRTLWTDAMRPGRMHDAAAVRTEGVDSCFRCFPEVEVPLDDGYPGLRRGHPHQALTPPRKPRRSALPEFHERWKLHRHAHSSDRITVEYALAAPKRWKQSTRWTHRRESLPADYRAIADRSPTAPRTPDKHHGRDHHASPAITHQLVRPAARRESVPTRAEQEQGDDPRAG